MAGIGVFEDFVCRKVRESTDPAWQTEETGLVSIHDLIVPLIQEILLTASRAKCNTGIRFDLLEFLESVS